MARPTKWRRIEKMPQTSFFIPSDRGAGNLPKVMLKLEELEAVRLKDLEGLEQEECAQKMEVSRPTFQRILSSARVKIADGLINGKAIHIVGGNFTLNICPVKCMDCGKEWVESYEKMEQVRSGALTCPNCGSHTIICANRYKEGFCRRNCHRHGRRGNPFFEE